MAMGRHGGLYFVLDNFSAMRDAMSIISKPFAESIPRKPWALVKNGDLLKLVHDFSNHRERSSTTGG